MHDKSSKIVKQIDGGFLYGLCDARLSKNKLPDLVVVASTGNNLYGLHTTYIFSQGPELRNVAIITGGEGLFRTVGRQRILQFVMPTTGVLEWAYDVCHACSPNLPLVLNFADGKTSNVTAQYPAGSV